MVASKNEIDSGSIKQKTLYLIFSPILNPLLWFSVMGGFEFVLYLETIQIKFFNNLGKAKQNVGINSIKLRVWVVATHLNKKR
ncbi:hypothetical protein A7A78_02950 [Aequorivita soesokkakensis]|uniref:Uncharacterized protein n=1 Tax=Aequorivita soesokkakensis TaxID=1385699 RepID=A0A1A9LDL3_9FLAO|nr:hypothetical protein A7A78_02950 [Aequorivita soesokkakensis]